MQNSYDRQSPIGPTSIEPGTKKGGTQLPDPRVILTKQEYWFLVDKIHNSNISPAP